VRISLWKEKSIPKKALTQLSGRLGIAPPDKERIGERSVGLVSFAGKKLLD